MSPDENFQPCLVEWEQHLVITDELLTRSEIEYNAYRFFRDRHRRALYQFPKMEQINRASVESAQYLAFKGIERSFKR